MLSKLLTLDEIAQRLAARARGLRLACNIPQKEFAPSAGVSLATLRRFEAGRDVSLRTFLQIMEALGRVDEIEELCGKPDSPALTIAERELREQQAQRGRRQRARRAHS